MSGQTSPHITHERVMARGGEGRGRDNLGVEGAPPRVNKGEYSVALRRRCPLPRAGQRQRRGSRPALHPRGGHVLAHALPLAPRSPAPPTFAREAAPAAGATGELREVAPRLHAGGVRARVAGAVAVVEDAAATELGPAGLLPDLPHAAPASVGPGPGLHRTSSRAGPSGPAPDARAAGGRRARGPAPAGCALWMRRPPARCRPSLGLHLRQRPAPVPPSPPRQPRRLPPSAPTARRTCAARTEERMSSSSSARQAHVAPRGGPSTVSSGTRPKAHDSTCRPPSPLAPPLGACACPGPAAP